MAPDKFLRHLLADSSGVYTQVGVHRHVLCAPCQSVTADYMCVRRLINSMPLHAGSLRGVPVLCSRKCNDVQYRVLRPSAAHEQGAANTHAHSTVCLSRILCILVDTFSLLQVIAYIRQRFPFYDASGGRDHAWCALCPPTLPNAPTSCWWCAAEMCRLEHARVQHKQVSDAAGSCQRTGAPARTGLHRTLAA